MRSANHVVYAWKDKRMIKLFFVIKVEALNENVAEAIVFSVYAVVFMAQEHKNIMITFHFNSIFISTYNQHFFFA